LHIYIFDNISVEYVVSQLVMNKQACFCQLSEILGVSLALALSSKKNY